MLRTKCCRLQLFALVEAIFNGFHAPKCSGNRQILRAWYAPPGSPDKARTPTCSAAGGRGEAKALPPHGPSSSLQPLVGLSLVLSLGNNHPGTALGVRSFPSPSSLQGVLISIATVLLNGTILLASSLSPPPFFSSYEPFKDAAVKLRRPYIITLHNHTYILVTRQKSAHSE